MIKTADKKANIISFSGIEKFLKEHLFDDFKAKFLMKDHIFDSNLYKKIQFLVRKFIS